MIYDKNDDNATNLLNEMIARRAYTPVVKVNYRKHKTTNRKPVIEHRSNV